MPSAAKVPIWKTRSGASEGWMFFLLRKKQLNTTGPKKKEEEEEVGVQTIEDPN